MTESTIPTETTETPRKSNKWFFISIILLLIGINAFMYWNNHKNTNKIETLTEEKDQLDSTYQQLRHDFERALAEVEQVRGENEALDSLVQIKSAALEAKKSEIQQIFMKQNLDKQDLARARELIIQLKHEKDDLLAQINTLKQENALLAKKIDTVITDLKAKSAENVELRTENTTLTEKLKQGAGLHLSNVRVIGENEKGNGKEKETMNVKRLDYLRICFDVDKNPLADMGNKEIAYRLLTPNNKLLYDPKNGGGTMILQDGMRETKYTNKVAFNFNNQLINICEKYIPQSRLEKGDYVIEFYQSGNYITSTKFKLTSSLL